MRASLPAADESHSLAASERLPTSLMLLLYSNTGWENLDSMRHALRTKLGRRFPTPRAVTPWLKIQRRHHGNYESRNSTDEGGPDS